MKNIFIIIVLSLISINSFAQKEIMGSVFDENGVLEFSNIILFNEKGEIVVGAVSNEKGEFKLLAKRGAYKINISFMGYENWVENIYLDEDMDIGKINLAPDANQLKGVIINTEKKLIERKVDRLVFNVDKSIAASGGDAITALKITPGVQIQNNKISLIGKNGVNILIDGRPIKLSGDDLTSFLKSISSDEIKKIEVITNPPAKYEAEGNNGLLNIVFKKGRNNKWNNNISMIYIQTTYPAYLLRNTFSYKKNKIKFLFNLNGKYGNEAVHENVKIFYPSSTWIDENKRKDQQDYISGRITLDYDVSDNATLGIQYLGNYKNPDIKDEGFLKIYDETNTFNSFIISKGDNDKHSTNNSINAHYTNELDSIGSSFSIDLDYFNFYSSQNRSFNSKEVLNSPTTLIDAINKSTQDIENYSLKVDVEKRIQKIKLSYGAKLSFINNDNTTEYYDNITGTPVLDGSQSDYFQYTENIQSAYVNASKKITSRWQTQIGFRLENTQTKGVSNTLNRTNNDKYLKLFPTFYLSYLKNDNNSFVFNYGKRINRPSYWELNPFRWYINKFSYSEGNPLLKPSISDNFELTYSFKNKLTTVGFLSIVKDGFSQVPTIDTSTNTQIFIRKNYFTQYRYGISESYLFDKINWLESYNQVYGYYIRSKFDSDIVNSPEQNGFTFYFRTSNGITLNTKKTIIGEVDFWYNSASSNGLYRVKKSSSLDLGIKFLLKNKAFQISATASDIFNSSSPDASTFSNEIQQIYNVNYDNRYYKLSVRYKFGNKKINVKRREFGNSDEKERIGN